MCNQKRIQLNWGNTTFKAKSNTEREFQIPSGVEGMGVALLTQSCGQKGNLSPVTIVKINSLVLFLEGWSNFQQWCLSLNGSRKCCRLGMALPCTRLRSKYNKRKKVDAFGESRWQPYNIRETALDPLPSESTDHGV